MRSRTVFVHLDFPHFFASESIHRPTTCGVRVAKAVGFSRLASLTISPGDHGFPARRVAVSIWFHKNGDNQLMYFAFPWIFWRLRPDGARLARPSSLNWRRGRESSASCNVEGEVVVSRSSRLSKLCFYEYNTPISYMNDEFCYRFTRTYSFMPNLRDPARFNLLHPCSFS